MPEQASGLYAGALERTPQFRLLQNANIYPHWVWRKLGHPILLEPNFSAPIGFRFGSIQTGAQNGSYSQNTNLFYGGIGSAQLVTPSTSGNLIQLIHVQPYHPADLLAFEFKFLVDVNGGSISFGIEPHTSDIWRSRFLFTVAGTWQYETAPGVYASFQTPPTINTPVVGFANTPASGGIGTVWGWARMVVNVTARTYVSFEAAAAGAVNTNGVFFYTFPAGTPLSFFSGSGTNGINLYCIVTTNANSARTFYTTDWCLSRVDPN